MSKLIHLLDQSFRTEIRNEVYNGVRDIEKIRKRFSLRGFSSSLTWHTCVEEKLARVRSAVGRDYIAANNVALCPGHIKNSRLCRPLLRLGRLSCQVEYGGFRRSISSYGSKFSLRALNIFVIETFWWIQPKALIHPTF